MVQSVQRSLNILNALGEINKKCTISEIATYTGLPPSTVHRLLTTLKEQRFVAKDEVSSLYYLGPSLVTLGIRASDFINLRKISIPIMKRLTEETGEDAYLAMADPYSGVIIERVAGSQPLKIIDPFNQQVAMHCGAMRKVLLAYKEDSFIRRYLEQDLMEFTENTITSKLELLNDLERIKDEEIAISIGEYINDAVGIAVPIKDKYGTVVASLGIIGPISRFTAEVISDLKKQVVKYGRILSNDLGYKRY